MQLEPGILEGGVVRHIGVLFHEFENLLLQRLVFAKGCFVVDIFPGDVMDFGERNTGLAVDLGQAAIVGLGIVRGRIARELHDLPAYVDDIAAFGRAPGRFDIDAEHRALDGLARESDAKRLAVSVDLAHDSGGAAALHLADGGAGVCVGQASSKHGGWLVAQSCFAHVIA